MQFRQIFELNNNNDKNARDRSESTTAGETEERNFLLFHLFVQFWYFETFPILMIWNMTQRQRQSVKKRASFQSDHKKSETVREGRGREGNEWTIIAGKN